MLANCTPYRVCLLVCVLAAAAVSGAGATAGRQFASNVIVVEVYATVTDDDGQAVTTLKKDDFEVFEDGVRQPVTTFASGDFPLSVALAIDRSWSMAGERLQLAKQAARTFLQQLRPDDRSMLIAVSSVTEVIAPLSADRGPALRALAQLQPWSSTALHDAVIASVGLIQPATGRRALVLLSDGVDRYSQATAADALQRARESDVLVYPIAFGRKPSPLFAELAVQTGGRSFAVANPNQLEKTFGAVAQELRHQYLLGYTPTRGAASGEADWRSIEVRVRQSGVRVRARPGYVAGGPR